MSDKSRIEAAIRTFLGTYKVQDVATRVPLFAEDVRFEDPVGSPPVLGRAALTKYFEDTVAGGWDIELSPQRIFVNGVEAVSITDVTAGVAGSPAVKSLIVQHFLFDDAGKIKTLRVFMDQPG